MAIRILRNQPIDFNAESDDPDCGCTGKNFCQLIDPTDATQFQISSTDLVQNGDFALGDEGWDTLTPIDIIVEITNVSNGGVCDGSASVSIGSPDLVLYSISLNGGAPIDVLGGGVVTFTGLCVGCYFVIVTKPDGQQGSIEFCIVENIICGDYSLTTDFVDVDTIQLANCYTTDFV